MTIVNTPAAYPLFYLWPIVIGLVSAFYCSKFASSMSFFHSYRNLACTLRAFMKRSAEFSQFLSSQPSSSNSGRYFRLMALATTEIVFTLPISLFGMYLNIRFNTIQPWISWDNIHFDYNRTGTFPSILFRSRSNALIVLEMSRWLLVFCAFIFFAFFGFAEEAQKFYSNTFWSIASLFVTVRPSQLPPPYATFGKKEYKVAGRRRVSGSLPSFVRRPSVSSSTAASVSSPFPPKLDFPTLSSLETSFDDKAAHHWRYSPLPSPLSSFYPPTPTSSSSSSFLYSDHDDDAAPPSPSGAAET